MLKKYKITLPDGQVIYSVQTEEPDISAEYKTTIMVDDQEYECDGEYDESDVDVEEFDIEFDEVQYQARQALKQALRGFTVTPFNIKHTITFKTDVLKKAIEQNIDFISQSQTRYNIFGIHFNFQENDVDIVATNGHALSFATIPNIYGFIGKFTIPLPVAYEILNYVNTNKDITDITLSLSEDLKQINFGEYNNFKLIEAEFPDYNCVIPEKFDLVAKIPKKEFNHFFEGFVSQEKVWLKLCNNTLLLGEDKIDCDFQGSVDIKLNSVYLANAIKQIDGNEFLLKANDDKKAISIQEVGNADKKYIIMQMN
jgi:DNA polymerase III sliding clamp (beta) subunit (PCNA family)